MPDERPAVTWTDRINYCVELTDTWEQRTVAGPEPVEPGSCLAMDDQRVAPSSSSRRVWGSLAMAVDHLGLAADALRRDGGAHLRPFAFYSLCRAALIPGARAVWLQLGDDEVRARRALFAEWEESAGMRTFAGDYVNDDILADDVNADVVAGLKRLRDQHDTAVADIKSRLRMKPTTRGLPREASTTEMLREVAQELAPHDRWLRRAYAYEWRTASASAHGLLWASIFRPGEVLSDPDEHTVQRKITTGTQESYGQSLAAATMTLQRAWDLWDERRLVSPDDAVG